MQQQKWSNTADLSFKPVDLSAKRKMPVLKDANSCSPSKKSLPSYMRQSGSSWSFKNSSPAGSPNTRPGNSTPVNSYKNYMHNENLSLSGELDGVRSPMRPGGYGISVRIRTPEGSFRASNYSHELGTDTKELGRQVTEASNCDAAGILYKWVNFGKGWRPRWFVLLDGVLSYYKLHGSDKISVTEETERGLRVIGENSVQLMRKGTSCHGRAAKSNQRKTVGAIHLKVSTIRESNSDDKKFSIFTGTKTLHLKAESREDKAAWIDILSSAKERFPSTSVSRNQLLPIEEITLSTDKLRCRLLEAGLKENVIRDCEEIMLSEFAQMQSQLKILQERGFNLLDTLRQLEVEKIELETTVVDESQCNLKARHSSEGGQEKSSASATESEEDNERQNGMEVESDEDDDIYFDTRDSLSESRRSTSSLYRRSSVGSDEELSDCGDIIHGTSGEEMEPELHGPGCPIMRRRRSLPEPLEKEKGVSLWSMIKDNIGKDLTKVCLPVYFNEPLSSLQKCFEDLEYSYLIDRASEWGKKGNSLMRILNVAAFAVSAYASSEGRNCKPFNPLLGETYEADYPDKGVRFLAEKVSHHPMMIACHCQGRGWRFWGDSNLKSKFWGRSIQLDPVGILTLEFDDGEVFQWSKVTTSIYNLILGKLYCDHYGTMRIQGNCEYFCKLKFKEQSIIDRSPHQVQGFVQDKSGNKVATLFGKWDESMFYVLGDINTKPKGYDPMSDACLLWKRSKPPKNPTRYNLTSFAITLNELTPGLKEKLPPTDSRLRPDQRYLENGQYELANSEKLRLEQRQRQSRKLQETGWKPRWFYKEKGQDTFKYIGGYWEARERGQWDNCPDIFGGTAHEIAID